MLRPRLLVPLLCLHSTTPAAAPWPHTERATGDWAGARAYLAEHGLKIELDYTAETFSRLSGSAPHLRYRGNIDLMLTLDTGKLGLWPGGELFVYGQNGHGRGVSSDIGALMLVTSLEAPEFTQLSELIFTQTFGDVLTLKLGKQDANADFAAPRFTGNFVSSSFGAPPPVPMPTFPTPAVGAAAFVTPVPWLELRAGAYEAVPRLEAFGGQGFDDGVITLGAVMLRHASRLSGVHSAGFFHTTADGRAGGFAVADLLVSIDDTRSVQSFARAAFAPKLAGAAHAYVGGGATAHGFLGADNTLGLGFGHVRYTGAPDGTETFIELFFKWRVFDWLTFEPDVQLFFFDGRRELVAGLRSKLKL